MEVKNRKFKAKEVLGEGGLIAISCRGNVAGTIPQVALVQVKIYNLVMNTI